ncbi:hypothetical protein M3Y96_01159600 [Aphelenchoides besseyi]|nr:hypothetical protein M3Y96_01159600 [Aphelenchoides besseyi]
MFALWLTAEQEAEPGSSAVLIVIVILVFVVFYGCLWIISEGRFDRVIYADGHFPSQRRYVQSSVQEAKKNSSVGSSMTGTDNSSIIVIPPIRSTACSVQLPQVSESEIVEMNRVGSHQHLNTLEGADASRTFTRALTGGTAPIYAKPTPLSSEIVGSERPRRCSFTNVGGKMHSQSMRLNELEAVKPRRSSGDLSKQRSRSKCSSVVSGPRTARAAYSPVHDPEEPGLPNCL